MKRSDREPTNTSSLYTHYLHFCIIQLLHQPNKINIHQINQVIPFSWAALWKKKNFLEGFPSSLTQKLFNQIMALNTLRIIFWKCFSSTANQIFHKAAHITDVTVHVVSGILFMGHRQTV